ncbi:hypothetical protein M5K25_021305 [Dendrobium thyrsiflorum]|uniref:Reverse transcriptase zinc-binding domain-containing protein n=1 Tax=Dendrobium thyrsiflorum TaxID=117978 RepID=A0ABD0UJ21_DENTH
MASHFLSESLLQPCFIAADGGNQSREEDGEAAECSPATRKKGKGNEWRKISANGCGSACALTVGRICKASHLSSIAKPPSPTSEETDGSAPMMLLQRKEKMHLGFDGRKHFAEIGFKRGEPDGGAPAEEVKTEFFHSGMARLGRVEIDADANIAGEAEGGHIRPYEDVSLVDEGRVEEGGERVAVENGDYAWVDVEKEGEGWGHICPEDGAFVSRHAAAEEFILALEPEVVEPILEGTEERDTIAAGDGPGRAGCGGRCRGLISDKRMLIARLGSSCCTWDGAIVTAGVEFTARYLWDRVLINCNWLDVFPNSFYYVDNPMCYDHSPLIVCNYHFSSVNKRFLFKNYWCKEKIIGVRSMNFGIFLLIIFLYLLLVILSRFLLLLFGRILMLLRNNSDTGPKGVPRIHIDDLAVLTNNIQTNPLDMDLNLALKNVNVRRIHMIAWKDFSYLAYLNDGGLRAIWVKYKYISLWKPYSQKVQNFGKIFALLLGILEVISLLIWRILVGMALQEILLSQEMTPFINMKVGDWINEGNWDIPGQVKSVIAWDKVDFPIFKHFYLVFFIKFNNVDYVKYIFLFLLDDYVEWFKMTDLLIKRNVNVHANCILCNNGAESHRHLFFECDFTFNIIISFVHGVNFFILRPNLIQIFKFIWNLNWNAEAKNLSCLYTCYTLYFVWKERNCRKMDNKFGSMDCICKNIRFAVQAKVFNWDSLPKIWHLNVFPTAESRGIWEAFFVLSSIEELYSWGYGAIWTSFFGAGVVQLIPDGAKIFPGY